MKGKGKDKGMIVNHDKILFIPKNLFIGLFLIVLTKHNDGFIDLSCAQLPTFPTISTHVRIKCKV